MHDFDQAKARVLDRTDIVEVVAEHVTLRRSGRRFTGLCPFHAEKTPSFTVNPELGIFKCFGCGKGGDVFTFVQERENVSFMEALRMLADRAGVELELKGRSTPGELTGADIALANDWAAGFFLRQLREPEGASARAYLEQRKFSPDVCERFQVGLAPNANTALAEAGRAAGLSEKLLLGADLIRKNESGRLYDTFRNRLMFPIRDATKRVVGFGGRTLGEDRAKYLNTSQNVLFDKGRGLYGIELARQRMPEAGRAVLVEGYTDCMAAHQAGFSETVATLGTALTEAQVDLLRRYVEQVVLLFDSDEAGGKAAERAIRVALPRYVTVKLARVPTGKDPADFLEGAGPEAFEALLGQAVDALDFMWRQTCTRYEGGTSDLGRRDAVLEFVGLIAEACGTGAVDPVRRGLLVNQVAFLLHLPADDVRRLMQQSERRRPPKAPAAGGVRKSLEERLVPDAVDAAWSRVLGVLLNEPGLAGTFAAGELEPRGIRGARDRRIAEVVLRRVEELGSEFRPADARARLEDPVDGERLLELVRVGADRGNYETTLEQALERIRQAGSAQATASAARALTQPLNVQGPPESDHEALEVFAQNVKEHRHFAPRRIIRHAVNEPESESGGARAE